MAARAWTWLRPAWLFNRRVALALLWVLAVAGIARWLPDAGLRKRVLVDNPARLYGF